MAWRILKYSKKLMYTKQTFDVFKITKQNKPIVGTSSWEYCIQPRNAYYVLSSLWCINESCSGNATYNLNSTQSLGNYLSSSPVLYYLHLFSARCGFVRMKNPFAYIGIPIGFLLILWIYIEIRHRASRQRQRLSMKESLPARVQDRKT